MSYICVACIIDLTINCYQYKHNATTNCPRVVAITNGDWNHYTPRRWSVRETKMFVFGIHKTLHASTTLNLTITISGYVPLDGNLQLQLSNLTVYKILNCSLALKGDCDNEGKTMML